MVQSNIPHMTKVDLASWLVIMCWSTHNKRFTSIFIFLNGTHPLSCHNLCFFFAVFIYIGFKSFKSFWQTSNGRINFLPLINLIFHPYQLLIHTFNHKFQNCIRLIIFNEWTFYLKCLLFQNIWFVLWTGISWGKVSHIEPGLVSLYLFSLLPLCLTLRSSYTLALFAAAALVRPSYFPP